MKLRGSKMKMKWVPFLRWLIRVERARHRRLTGKIIVCQICMILFLSLTTPSHSTTVFFFLFLFFPCPCLCGNTILFDQASAATLIFFFFFFFSLILLCTWEKDKRTRIHSYTYNTIQKEIEKVVVLFVFVLSIPLLLLTPSHLFIYLFFVSPTREWLSEWISNLILLSIHFIYLTNLSSIYNSQRNHILVTLSIHYRHIK